MKRLITYLVLPVVLLNIFSCSKKKYPESVIENQPVYYSKFDLNGRALEFHGGENNYYMYSEVSRDTMNVNEHTSTFRQMNCSSCGPAIKFVIRDYKATGAGNTSNIDSTIHKGFYEYLTLSKGPLYEAQFSATQDGNGAISSIDWDFGDGTTQTGSTVTHTFKKSGLQKICASLRTVKGCVSNLCNDQFIASNSLNCVITSVKDTNTNVIFTAAVSGGVPPYNYSWDFGDGGVAKGIATVTHPYPYQGSYLARLTVTDAAGGKSVTQYNVVTLGDLSSCAVNFSRTSIKEISDLRQSLSKVKIVYTDEQGVNYQSLAPEQPNTSYFEILDIREGEINENGRPTKIVNLRFNCEVFNGSQKLMITNGISTISVAY